MARTNRQAGELKVRRDRLASNGKDNEGIRRKLDRQIRKLESSK